jgi:hypothetical protein
VFFIAGTYACQHLNVGQFPESESGREVVCHQIGGRLKKIWKRHFTTGSSPEKRLSTSMLLTEVSEVNEVSILSTSLR